MGRFYVFPIFIANFGDAPTRINILSTTLWK